MRKLTWAAALALGLISMPALAADDQGFYAGVGVGELSVDFSGDIDGTLFSFDDGDTAFRLFGGWQFNEYFALEGGYVDGGTASETFTIDGVDVDFDVEVTGFDVLLKGILPLSESFHAFAEAGMIFWDADLSATSGGLTESESDSGEDLAYGAGFGFNMGDNAAVRLEYVFYDVSEADVEAFMASLLWKFR